MISVIVPIYNGENCIKRTIQCLQNQQFTDFEVLLINDGSTDHTHDICAAASAADSRFRLIDQPNGGVSSARNHGLKLCRGEFVTFIDDDDELNPEYLSALYRAIIENDADMSVCDVAVVEDGLETKRFTCPSGVLSQTETLNFILTRQNINSGPCAKMFRREILDGLNFPNLKVYEDILFVVDAVCKCSRIVATNQVTYFYLQSSSSTMGNFKKMPSLDIVVASKRLLERISARKNLSPSCLYTTLSHLMQYVQPLVNNPSQQAKLFVWESRKLLKSQICNILMCPAFPWKEKIVFIMFACGWYYQNKKILRI